MKVSRQRIRAAKPIGRIVISYLTVMTILFAFLVGLFLLVALELFLIN